MTFEPLANIESRYIKYLLQLFSKEKFFQVLPRNISTISSSDKAYASKLIMFGWLNFLETYYYYKHAQSGKLNQRYFLRNICDVAT